MTRLVVLQHLEREGPGLFALEASRRGWPIQGVRLDRGEPLPQLEVGDLLLVLGGPMGVADLGNPAYPWLRMEVELLRQALDRQNPVIGGCLGAQLLALAAGGGAIPLQVGDPPRLLREVGFGAISWCHDPAHTRWLRGLSCWPAASTAASRPSASVRGRWGCSSTWSYPWPRRPRSWRSGWTKTATM